MSGRCSLAKALELLAPDFAPMAAAAKIEQAIHEDDHFPLYCNGETVKANIRAIAKVVPKREEDGRSTADIESTGPGLGWARGAYNWELEEDAVLALKPQPDTRAEAAQATAISAMQMAEAATAEATSARTAADTARAKVEELQAAAEARAEAVLDKPWATVSGSVNWTPPTMLTPATPEALSPEIDRILDDLPQRRSVGGRPPEHNWRIICGEIARRCHDPKTGRVRVPESERKLARDMLQWCLDKYNKEPADSEMRDAVSKVCAALRPLEKK